MEPQLEQIRDQQKQTWDEFSGGWKKWDDLVMGLMQSTTDAITAALDLEETDEVLDVAGGTGEPAITIASLVRGGKVICTDISDAMMDTARMKVKQRNIQNIEFALADVSELPFEDNAFDAVVCRFGFMFFPDMQLAASEIVRVLKPGGKFATTVWNIAGKNFWVTAIMGPVQTNLQLSAPDPNAPGMFRCAAPGLLAGYLRTAGLTDLEENEISSKMDMKSPEFYWRFMNDVAAPVVAPLDKASPAAKEKIRKEVFDSLKSRFGENELVFDASALLISGTKPAGD